MRLGLRVLLLASCGAAACSAPAGLRGVVRVAVGPPPAVIVSSGTLALAETSTSAELGGPYYGHTEWIGLSARIVAIKMWRDPGQAEVCEPSFEMHGEPLTCNRPNIWLLDFVHGTETFANEVIHADPEGRVIGLRRGSRLLIVDARSGEQRDATPDGAALGPFQSALARFGESRRRRRDEVALEGDVTATVDDRNDRVEVLALHRGDGSSISLPGRCSEPLAFPESPTLLVPCPERDFLWSPGSGAWIEIPVRVVLPKYDGSETAKDETGHTWLGVLAARPGESEATRLARLRLDDGKVEIGWKTRDSRIHRVFSAPGRIASHVEGGVAVLDLASGAWWSLPLEATYAHPRMANLKDGRCAVLVPERGVYFVLPSCTTTWSFSRDGCLVEMTLRKGLEKGPWRRHCARVRDLSEVTR